MKRFLITSADERTWPKDRPVLFLGQWCKLYDRRHVWAVLDSEVVPYHWDDRKKLYQDYQYLQDLYENILAELAAKLNQIHGVDHSLRYWRIILGPWLSIFTEILFDRWEMIRRSIADDRVAGARVLDKDPSRIIPNDMADFLSLFPEDDWNEAIYGMLLKGWTSLPIENVPCGSKNEIPKTKTKLSSIRKLRGNLINAVSAVLNKLVKRSECFLLSTYLPVLQDFHLQIKLGQAPKLWGCIPSPKSQADTAQRNWQIGKPGVDVFSSIVREMIPRNIPTLYLEGYKALQELCSKLPWPKNPGLIFTSNSFYSDDVFKAWTALNVERGVPFVIGQHGGNYGIGLWESLEEHQYKISDCWLSWGWSDSNRPHIKPMCNFKMVGSDSKWDPDGDALLIEMTVPRFSYRMYSVPVASQWLDYFEDQCRFVKALPEQIRRKLKVRIQQQDYGWQQKQRWEDRCPDVSLDGGHSDFASLIKKSRVCISTHNATTFLETLAMNIPTIVFWDPQYYEIRDNVLPHLELLKTAGIFHSTPESAAKQLVRVWGDVAAWWESKAVQDARKEFCYRYSRMPERPLEEIERTLRHISKECAK